MGTYSSKRAPFSRFDYQHRYPFGVPFTPSVLHYIFVQPRSTLSKFELAGATVCRCSIRNLDSWLVCLGCEEFIPIRL